MFSPSKLFLNFFACICILPSASCALSVSHLSPLKVQPVEKGGTECSLWRLPSQTVGNRSTSRSNGLLLCEPSLALCNSPLFISLMSLAGYMLLIKHAAWLLIVNQIQFVPWAHCEWASPHRTKVSEQPCQSHTKGRKHHFYLKQCAGSYWMRCYPGRFPSRCSWEVLRKLSCTSLHFLKNLWHQVRN